MCWLNSCCELTKQQVEYLLTLTGSKLVPSGVVMRDQETGTMVIVERGKVITLPMANADAMLRHGGAPCVKPG